MVLYFLTFPVGALVHSETRFLRMGVPITFFERGGRHPLKFVAAYFTAEQYVYDVILYWELFALIV